MNIVLLDDDINILKELKDLISNTFKNYNQIKLYSSYDELINSIDRIDILFIDIKLNNENAIDLIKRDINKFKNTKIIYITGYDYIEDIFETSPFYYLKKPITKEKLEKVYNKLIENKKNISVKFDKEIKRISKDDIIYVDSYARIINFHLKDNSIIKSYNKMSELENNLPNNFLRIHKSYIINMDKVKSYSKSEIILYDNTKLKIGRIFKQKVEDKLLNYIKETDLYV